MKNPINNKLYKLYLFVFGDNTYPHLTKSLILHKITLKEFFYFDSYGGNEINGRQKVSFLNNETILVERQGVDSNGDSLVYIVGYKI